MYEWPRVLGGNEGCWRVLLVAYGGRNSGRGGSGRLARDVGGTADDQLGLDSDLIGMADRVAQLNAIEDCFRGDLPHFPQGLAHRRKAWILEGGGLDVVETDHRYILRNAHPRLAQGADGAQRGNVVEAN